MNQGPVFTEITACQDCYRCLRHCPVKAIRVREGKAEVQKELCLNCGRCLRECPSHAKKIRSDFGRVRQLLAIGRPVVASIAPSWVAEFQDLELVRRRIAALGFRAVEETAFGARMLAEHCRKDPSLARGISSACPVIVEYVTRYRPELISALSPLVSPLEAHARSLKSRYGKDTTVVFIGPCVAKKLEADSPDTSVDLALTYRELQEWFESIDDESGEPNREPSSTEGFNHLCEDFFLEGGFLRALESADNSPDQIEGFAISGLESVLTSLETWTAVSRESLPAIELLACSGGCHNGPGTCTGSSVLDKRMRATEGLNDLALSHREVCPSLPELSLTRDYVPRDLSRKEISEEQLREFLASLGRPRHEDDPDCGSCGYGSCRDFASAVIEGMAEESMCVSVMRQRAQDQSDALMRSLPLGAVIVDQEMKIRECNSNFLRLFTELDFDPPESAVTEVRGRALSGYLEDLVPFRRILSGSIDSFSGSVSSRGRIFRTTIFPVGQDDLAGAVFQDITVPRVERETVIHKAEEVIQKNLSSVQQIASLLGENAAETQLILDSLIGAFNE